jgi:transcriptional regulator with XRE-family HTH domain
VTGDEVRAARERLGWSQSDLAEALSVDPARPPVSRVTVAKWEAGHPAPPYLRLAVDRLLWIHNRGPT